MTATTFSYVSSPLALFAILLSYYIYSSRAQLQHRATPAAFRANVRVWLHWGRSLVSREFYLKTLNPFVCCSQVQSSLRDDRRGNLLVFAFPPGLNIRYCCVSKTEFPVLAGTSLERCVRTKSTDCSPHTRMSIWIEQKKRKNKVSNSHTHPILNNFWFNLLWHI